ncbi:MAG: cation transporter [Ignavibacteriales bacterium]|nr:cation transporter [Ignavibacteriales bacterium]
MKTDKTILYKYAVILAIITVFYNLIEGLISVYFGMQDETISLFGFGLDSFVEVISGIGIWHMLIRIKNKDEERDEFEKTALRITGTAFYILVAGLVTTAIFNIYINHKPETTFWGIVISLISIITMSALIFFKMKVGRALNSKALIADANCTKTCLYLSIILLATSICYELTGFGGIDSAGALLIAYFSFKEGREVFEKAKTGKNCECENNH